MSATLSNIVRLNRRPADVDEQLQIVIRTDCLGGVCHERRREPAMLYQRWELASRSLLAGAGFKPPGAAASKRRGGERPLEKALINSVR